MNKILLLFLVIFISCKKSDNCIESQKHYSLSEIEQTNFSLTSNNRFSIKSGVNYSVIYLTLIKDNRQYYIIYNCRAIDTTFAGNDIVKLQSNYKIELDVKYYCN